MITNSALEQQKNKTLFNTNYLHVTLFHFYFSGFWKERDIQESTFYKVDYWMMYIYLYKCSSAENPFGGYKYLKSLFFFW